MQALRTGFVQASLAVVEAPASQWSVREIAGEHGDDHRRCGSSSRKKSAGVLGIVTLGLNGGYNMAIAPTNKREADEMALKLSCLLAFILVGLITAGVL
jgi:hypothetical protein